MMTAASRLFTLLALVTALSGCAMLDKLLGITPASPLKQVQLVAELGANQDSATAIDLVFVYDDNARNLLPKTGPEWFANKAALLASLTLALDVVSLQVPPASSVPVVPLPGRHHKALAVYSYVNFLSPAGQPMGQLTPFKCAQVTLTATAVRYQACNT